MFNKNKVEKEVMNELKSIKKAREKLEGMVKEVKEIKDKLKVYDMGIGKIARVVSDNKNMIDVHNEGILEIADRVEKLEKPDKEEKDNMVYQ